MPEVTFARYTLRERLRELGPGVACFRAAQSGLDREVELRIFDPKNAGEPRNSQDFQREYRLLGKLDHPGFVAILDAGVVGGRPFYATDLRLSRSLLERLASGRLEDDALLRLARDLSSALHYLHDRKLLHAGIEASRVLEDGEHERFYFADASTFVPIGGLPDQMAHLTPARLASVPEVVRGSPPGKGADVFLLGMLLFQAATAVDPMPLLSGSTGRANALHPTDYTPELPAELSALIHQCLAPEPDRRFPDMESFREAVETVEKKLRIRSFVDESTLSAAIPIVDAGATSQDEDDREAFLETEKIPLSSPADTERIPAAQPTSSAPRPAPTRPLAVEVSLSPPDLGAMFSGASLKGVGLLTGGGLAVIILLGLLLRPSGEPDPASAPRPSRPTLPARPQGQGPPTRVGAPSPLADELLSKAYEVADHPTDGESFMPRWQFLKKWLLSQSRERRMALFSYGQLVQVKIDFTVDPPKAAAALDRFYLQARNFEGDPEN